MTVRIQPNGYTLGRQDPGDWPLLGPDSYLAAVPAYTADLATKLAGADADVAAAINAAQRAEAAAQAATGSSAALSAGNFNCSVVSAWRRVAFELVLFNDWPAGAVVDGAFVVPASGRYLVTAGARVGAATAARRQFAIQVDGSQWAQATATDAYHAVSMARELALTQGQVVDLGYNVPAAIQLQAPTYLTMRRIK